MGMTENRCCAGSNINEQSKTAILILIIGLL